MACCQWLCLTPSGVRMQCTPSWLTRRMLPGSLSKNTMLLNGMPVFRLSALKCSVCVRTDQTWCQGGRSSNVTLADLDMHS